MLASAHDDAIGGDPTGDPRNIRAQGRRSAPRGVWCLLRFAVWTLKIRSHGESVCDAGGVGNLQNLKGKNELGRCQGFI